MTMLILALPNPQTLELIYSFFSKICFFSKIFASLPRIPSVETRNRAKWLPMLPEAGPKVFLLLLVFTG